MTGLQGLVLTWCPYVAVTLELIENQEEKQLSTFFALAILQNKSGNTMQRSWPSIKGILPEKLVYAFWNFKNFIASFTLKIMPPIILWELWRSRCSAKYDDKNLSLSRSTTLINLNISQLITDSQLSNP